MKQAWIILAAAWLAACQAAAPADTPAPATEASEAVSEAVSPLAVGMKERVDAMLSSAVARGDIAGGSALVWIDGQEVYFGAFGMADREAGTQMDRATLARLYSMTKPVTGVTLMTLYDKSLFSLDDPLSKYFPEFANTNVYAGLDENGEPVFDPPARAPLVIDLMRHTAGLSNVGDDETVIGDMFRSRRTMRLDQSLSEMAQDISEIPLYYQPGERWLYSPSVDMQAALVEKLSGKPYYEYLKETVLDPLGMSETDYYVPESERGRMMQVYVIHEDGTMEPDPSNDQGMQLPFVHARMTPGGYGLVSTVDDYMKFARMLVNKGELDGVRILKPETVELMGTNHMPDTVKDRYWLPNKGQVGFGLDFAVRHSSPVSDEENYGVPGEFFWDGKASTLFWVDPENKLTAVLFIQVLPFDTTKVQPKFRDAVYGVRNSGLPVD